MYMYLDLGQIKVVLRADIYLFWSILRYRVGQAVASATATESHLGAILDSQDDAYFQGEVVWFTHFWPKIESKKKGKTKATVKQYNQQLLPQFFVFFAKPKIRKLFQK